MNPLRIVALAHAWAGCLSARLSADRPAMARFSWQAGLTRALIGILGGLALAIAFMAGSSALLAALQWMTRADAVVTTGMLAFLVWTAAVLVSFGAESIRRAAGWVLGGSAVFALLGAGGNYLIRLA